MMGQDVSIDDLIMTNTGGVLLKFMSIFTCILNISSKNSIVYIILHFTIKKRFFKRFRRDAISMSIEYD